MVCVESRDGSERFLGSRLGLGFGVEMEETELEEGEACYDKEGEDNASIDPDIALSYIDEKLQHVLGHFQKDFEGGVSAENLGAKFGGYGSFLPTYQRSPSIWSQPKTPQRAQNHNPPRSPNNLPVEGAPQNSRAPSDAPLSVTLGAASCSAHSSHISSVPYGDVSAKQNLCLSSAQVAEKFPLKHEPSNKSVHPTDQRILKVRIKVGSDNTALKNAAIYSGLGLDNSPSSSMGNSPEESAGMLPESRETPDESPTSILKIMTSFPVPGGLMLSPLHDSLLWLIRNERRPRNSKPAPALKGSQEHSAMLVDDSASMLGDGKVLKERKTKLAGRSGRLPELKHGSGMDFENGMTSLFKNKINSQTPEGKEFFSNDSKLTPLSNAVVDVGDSAKGARKASEVSREANKDGVKNRLFSSDLAKEESSESISGQDSGKSEKQNAKTSSAGKSWECRIANSHKDVPVDPRANSGCKGNIISAPSKADSDTSKYEEDLGFGMDPSKQKVGQKATFHKQDGIKMPRRMEKPSSEGKKKSKGSQSNDKPAADLAEESLKVGFCAAEKDKKSTSYGVYTCNSKMHNLKSQKDTGKVRDNYRDLLGDRNLEQTDNQMDPLERPSGDMPKDSELKDVGKERHAFFDESKERSSGKKVDNEASNAAPPSTDNGLTSEMAPTAVAPVVIEENWVCCDSCQKWRLLPFGTKTKNLPEKWLCIMLNWLPGMNRCDISEEETTKALNVLYQLPVPESQNNLNNHANGTALDVTSADVRHLDQNHQNLSSHGMPNRGKKKHGSKEIPNAASNSGPIQISHSTKNLREESLKSRSLNDMDQLPSESNLMNKSSFQHLSKSRNFAVEKNAHKQKEKHINGGAKHTKMKSKREADQYGNGASKKIKTEGADKYLNFEHVGDLGRVGLSSSTGLPTKRTGKDMQKYIEHCHSKDTKFDAKDGFLVSVKKLGDQAQVSSDVKKLKDWHDNQDNLETFQTTGRHLPVGKVSAKEESSESEFRKEKKPRVSKTEGKESSTSKGDDRLNNNGRATQILLSCSGDHPVDSMEEVRSTEKDQQLRKQRGKIASQRTLDGPDSLKRDLGSRQVSMAATSSSSKVSGSHKTRANFQEVKGSPEESVSSSPLRASNPDKLTPARTDILGKGDATNGGLPVMGSPRRCSDGEGNGESNRSGISRKEKVSCVFRPESLEFPAIDDWDRDPKFCGQAKSSVEPSSEFGNSHSVNGDADTIEQHGQYPGDPHASEHCYNEDSMNKNHDCENALCPQKSGKDSSLRSKDKDKDRSYKSDFDRDKMKAPDPLSEQEELYSKKSLRYESKIDPHHLAPCHVEMGDVKHNFPDKCSIKFNKDEKYHVSKKDSVGKRSSDSRKENRLKSGEPEGSDAKLGAICSTKRVVTPQQNLIQDFEGERFSNGFFAKKTDPLIQIESRGGKSQLFPHHEGKHETLAWGFRPVPESQKGGVFDALPVDVTDDGDMSKAFKQPGNAGNRNGAHHTLGHLTPNRHGVRDLNAPSPVRKDSSSQTASNALKEAKDLRDYANRLKSSGFGFESNEVYFQAALKFLHGASLLETCNSESGKHVEMTQMQMYSSTVKLCEFCAHEYERRQEMAAAALAYKCMEVAYMRVVYCKHSSTSRDRHELQANLQMVPQGESPSSSASDVDNLNNQTTLDRAALSRGTGSHVAGNHVIVARNRPNFVRLLDFTQDVNFAMEALRKSQNAFAAANVVLEENQNREGITSVKRVIDFSFEDVEELVHLVRLAKEAISRSGISGSRD